MTESVAGGISDVREWLIIHTFDKHSAPEGGWERMFAMTTYSITSQSNDKQQLNFLRARHLALEHFYTRSSASIDHWEVYGNFRCESEWQLLCVEFYTADIDWKLHRSTLSHLSRSMCIWWLFDRNDNDDDEDEEKEETRLKWIGCGSIVNFYIALSHRGGRLYHLN